MTEQKSIPIILKHRLEKNIWELILQPCKVYTDPGPDNTLILKDYLSFSYLTGMYNKNDRLEIYMMLNRRYIYLGILILMTLFLSSCGGSLLKAENPLEKGDAGIPSAESPDNLAPDNETTQLPPETEEIRSQDMITIALVFDNYPHQPGMETAWGFSAFITYGDQNLLFDTGADGNLLLKNMAALDIEPAQIQNVVLSHEHTDHTGGMQSLLAAGADPKVYIPPSFSEEFKRNYSRQIDLIEVSRGMEIVDRIHSLGEMQGPPPEQSIVIATTKGLVVITGCAHPGIEDIVLKAKQQYKDDIYLVLGGFHLGNASEYQVNEIIKEFNRLGVEHIAPCHCTGEQVISKFHDAFGEDFIQVGVGSVIEIEN